MTKTIEKMRKMVAETCLLAVHVVDREDARNSETSSRIFMEAVVQMGRLKNFMAAALEMYKDGKVV